MMKGMVFAERYKLEDFIGQGGMSLVYRAVDIRTGHSVAVKILKSEYNSDKEFLERFQREAQAASLMSHHNLVNLLDVGVEGEHRYLVLEYVNGNTLKDIIRQKGRINYQTAIQVTIRILSALQHAHDNGIIHRDIKPQNVLIHADGHVKVADFGIARMTGGATIGKGDTVVGSVHYSSPEQATGSVVEAASDLYSTGVVMYEMLTGRVPFVGDTPVAVAMQHIQDAPPPIADFAPETPAAVIAVVMKALEKDPKRRFQTAREMAEALMLAKNGQLDPASIQPEPAQPAATPVVQPNPAQPVAPVKEISPVKPAPARRSTQTARRAPVKKRSKLTVLISTLALAAAVLGLLTFGVIRIYKQVSQSALAPNVIGLTVEDGRALATRQGLNWQETDIYHDTIPAGQVISQIPEEDTPMQKGDSLLATVSLGPANSAMPDVVGLGYEDAANRLTERGFGRVVAMKVVSTSAVGTVLDQSPRAGDPYTPGQAVELTISGGSVMVPKLTGRSREDAVAELLEIGLSEASADFVETSDPAQIGQVLAQSPAEGTMLAIGSPVTLTVGNESQPYHGELALTVPESDQECVLRVMLINGDREMPEFERTLPAGDQRVMIVPISASFSGEVMCRIYVDNVLLSEDYVTLY